MEVITILSIVIALVLAYLLYKLRGEKGELTKKLNEYESKYQGIIDVDKEIKSRKSQFTNQEATLKNQIAELEKSFNQLKAKYHKASEIFSDLEYQNQLLKDDLEIADFGVYEPQFDYETSEIFKGKIKEVREEQKQLIKDNLAVLGGENWTVNGSSSEGKKMVNRQKKLMLRAFNGETDSFIKGVKWNNETRMEERIRKSADAINKTGETQNLIISTQYSSLKLIELRLTHEYQLKKNEEKERQRQIREQMREEEKARIDFEKAHKEAEKEGKLLQKAMKKAQDEIAKASEAERSKFEEQLAKLEEQLKIAEDKNKRAISMAQRTKAGHVYVISNIGSFGENIYKIGMTRRLEPLDRVNELGDASVPFKFDVHAMIYSENAPELENELHKVFDKYRVNHVNRRREYFKISLEDIEKVVRENHGEIEFVIEPEAKEYRESLVILDKMNKKPKVEKSKFPLANEIFN
jgi:hypothetical protein